MTTIRPGDRVRMTEAHRLKLRTGRSRQHESEFGECVGVVIGLTDFGTALGPELDVRWAPSGLRYAYHPSELERVQ